MRCRRTVSNTVALAVCAALIAACDSNDRPGGPSPTRAGTAPVATAQGDTSDVVAPGPTVAAVAPAARADQADLPARHPLDGLTAEELAVVRDTVVATGKVSSDDLAFPVLELREPPKADVLAWQPGEEIPRVAHAVVVSGGKVSDVEVDLVAGAIRRWEPADSTRYPFVAADFGRTVPGVLADRRFVAALSRRSLRPDEITCLTFGPGQPRLDRERGRRLARVGCYLRGENFWSRPVEGLVGTYDLDASAVTEVIDDGSTPAPAELPWTDPSFVPVALTAPNPAIVTSGPGVRWERWQFRWRVDRRAGLVINDAVIRAPGAGTVSSVLYQGYMSEMYVPYQDPAPAWAWRTFMDSGEFGLGTYLSPLVPGIDCPPDAVFDDAVVPSDSGLGRVVTKGVCIFQRETRMADRRHSASGSVSGNAGAELVVRSVSTVGNYDYTIDYVFGRDLSLRIDVGASGVVLQKATTAQTSAEHTESGGARHGTLVAPGLIGVNHDHFLAFRLDLDVLGAANRFVRQRLVPEPVGDDPSRTGIWATEDEVVTREGAVDAADPSSERWLFAASGPTAEGGSRPAIVLDPVDAIASPIASSSDPGLRRAAWSEATLWVTARDPDERYAGGADVLGSTGDDGLARWAADGRRIDGQDLVAWVTVGFHHVVRAEDVPNMPTHEASVELRPENLVSR